MIFLTGATGLAGSDVTAALARRNEPIRIALHEKGIEIYEPDAQTVVVRYDDIFALENAMRDCKALFLLTPFGPMQESQEIALIDAAVRAGIAHIVKQSVLGVEFDEGFELAAKHRAIEAHLKSTGISHTILRPAPFFQDFAYHHGSTIRREDVFYRPEGEQAVAYVDARDVAEAAVRALLDPDKHGGRTYRLTGPETLTIHDIAQSLSEGLGRTIRFENVKEEQFRDFLRGHGVDDHSIDALVEVHQICCESEAGAVRDDLEGVIGREGTTFDTFVSDFHTAFEPAEEPEPQLAAEPRARAETRR